VLLGILWELREHGVTIEYSIENWWEHQNPQNSQILLWGNNNPPFVMWMPLFRI